MKKDTIIIFSLIIIGMVGILMGTFIGGALFGFALAMILFISIGKWQLKKATDRLDAIQKNHSQPKNEIQ